MRAQPFWKRVVYMNANKTDEQTNRAGRRARANDARRYFPARRFVLAAAGVIAVVVATGCPRETKEINEHKRVLHAERD